MKIVAGAVLGMLLGVAVSTATHRPSQDAARCIPCGPNRPCVNPLTVCVGQSPNGNGCCLGFAN